MTNSRSITLPWKKNPPGKPMKSMDFYQFSTDMITRGIYQFRLRLYNYTNDSMWSNSLLNEFPTYHSQYAIELLHSLGSIFDNNYLNNANLRNLMIDLAKQDEKCFYQLAFHAYIQLQRNNSADLRTIFNNQTFNAIKDLLKENVENPEKTKFYDVPTVYVTSSSTRIMPLESIQGHRALRHKSFNGVHDFCLVYLKPEPPARYINKCRRYQDVFQSGIEICNFRYHLFGASNSQFREHSYWFVRATSLEDIHQKRRLLGDFSSIHNIGKYVARLGQWFSKSHPTNIKLNYISDVEDFNRRVQEGDMCVAKMDDIERNGYCFTDGNGLISKGLARFIAERLDYLVKTEQNEVYPSAYQIRMAGCKGLVIIDPASTMDEFYIKIRPSMKKFDCDEWDLDICEASQPIPTRLNNQIIILMSDLGIPDSTFLAIQDQWFANKKQPPHSTENLLKNKLPLPMNECRYIFGCALESKLQPGECFLRYQIVDDNGKPLKNPEFKTVVGQVIITKNPCPYAGDIMKLEAVDLPELYCLQDVIVFSTKGDRPDCNKIAGSDLDGDQYFIYWGEQLQLPETIEPLEYKTQSPTIPSTSITPLDFINYCLSSLGSTTYGEIYNLHAIIVDQNNEKYSRRTCQKLAVEMANMFSAAIDSGKTGYEIDRNRIRQIRKITGSKYPDFLMKKNSYPSESILGILYRRGLEFKNQNPNLFENQDIDNPKNSLANPNEKNFRFYVRVRTALNIDPLIIHEELESVYGDKTPSNLIIEKWSSKQAIIKQSKESSSDVSSEEIEKFRSVIDNNLYITTNEVETNTDC